MDLVGGAVDPRGGYVSKILHVKTKESGPVGGAHAGCAPLDPPMISLEFFASSTCKTSILQHIGLLIKSKIWNMIFL